MKLEPNSFDSPTVSIGSAVRGLMHTVEATSAGIDPLKGHPGRSLDIMSRGLHRWISHVSRVAGTPEPSDEAYASLNEAFEKGQRICESPIERNMLAALLTGDWPMCRAIHPAVHNAKNYDEPFPNCEVVIVPQMALLRYRLDLGVVVRLPGGVPKTFGIECDGKEFHQDAERDRQRDAYFSSLGVRTLHISGKALNFEPIAVADAIIDGIAAWMVQ